MDVLLFFECPCELSFEAFLVSRLDALANELVQCPLDTLTEVGDRFRREQILLDGGKELFFEAGCGSVEAYRLTARPGSKSPVRPGVWKCRACRKQFTVTVGTIFEDSHIPLNKWLHAIHELCASKKGKSAHQLHRTLGVTYKSAWFLAHRIRWAMTQPPLVQKLLGTVEVDEAYIGGKARAGARRAKGQRGRSPEGNKVPVVVLVERQGKARTMPVGRVTARNLRGVIADHVDPSAVLMTDDYGAYYGAGRGFAGHKTVSHSQGQYVQGDVHTNTAESYFATLKRGITGIYHHVGKNHLHRYLGEFDFRYNTRKRQDGERTALAIQKAEGKRLMFKRPTGKQT